MNRFRTLPVRPVWLLCLLAAAMLLITACNPGLVPQTGTNAGELTLEVTDSAVNASGTIAPGVTNVSIQNTGQTPRFVMLARLNTDVTLEQFMETFAADDMAAVQLVKLSGGRDAPPGETRQIITDLKEGTHAVIAFPEEDAPPLVTSFVVSGSATGAAAPSADLTVDMIDFAFVIPAEVPAGGQTWALTNTGAQWHELALLKPAPGFTQEQFMEMFQSNQEPQGEPPFTEVGSFGPLSEGERAWLPLDLEAGTYMAVCFLPDFASGQSHVEKGMISTFEVGQ